MKVTSPLKELETPVEIEAAARTFTTGLPIFKKLVDDLSMKSLKRLLVALVEFGLHDDKTQLIQQAEVPVFEVGMELLEAKAQMIEYAVAQKQKESKNETTTTQS